MKILHLRSPSGLYGAERVIIELFRENRRKGNGYKFDLAYFGNDRDLGFTETLKREEIPALRIPSGTRISWNTLRELIRHIKARGTQVIHSHDYKSDFYALVAKFFLSDIKLVSTNHNWILSSMNQRIYATFDSKIMNYFDELVAVSIGVKAEMVRFGVNERKIVIIENGIGPMNSGNNKSNSINMPKEIFTVIFVGSLTPEKGIDVLFKSIFIIKSERPSIKFQCIVLGEGPLRQYLENLAREYGIGNEVFFLGHCTDVYSYLESAHVFVLPSRREGTPISLLEAMQASVPIIASAVGGIPNMIGESGILVTPEDPKCLKDALLTLYDSPNLRSEYSTAARKRFEENYDSSRMYREYLELYDNIIWAH